VDENNIHRKALQKLQIFELEDMNSLEEKKNWLIGEQKCSESIVKYL
jgi:hypothetical protein